ncbi:MAG: YcnI family protein [Burkholderiales bacterium]
MKTLATIAAIALLGLAVETRAHVVLDQPTAPAGSSYRAVFRVGHGCDGLPTRAITVRIPAGVQGAKPMPKPGWALATRTETLATPYLSHGKRIDADVTEVAWTATAKDAFLPDAWYDEFVLRATLPAETGAVWFQVVQTCDDNGRDVRKEWAQVPKEGNSTRGLPLPAALLLIEPAAPGHVH